MNYRDYDSQKDKDAVRRIWLEIGWVNKEKIATADLFTEAGRTIVAELNGAAECVVSVMPGTLRYIDEDLPFASVTAVATSRIARRKKLAGRLTALAIARAAADGALISGLGMFEQGYYNKLGFGTGSYEHWVSFDPAQLRVKTKARTPRRVTLDDWELVHNSRLARWRGHGACSLKPPKATKAEMIWSTNGFGLGYRDGANGELTHHFWSMADNVEFGPYTILWITYQNPQQFLELMALIKSLGDQVRLVKMWEPRGIQFQDLLEKPFRQHAVTRKSEFENRIRAAAYWQMRVCNLRECLARTHLRCVAIRFNLKLTDPIENFLERDAPWRGISGEYIVTLGQTCGAESGVDASLPTLQASVGAFTRMWLGVLPATGLAMTDKLTAPRELLERLDWAFRLPKPKPDWEF